MDNKLTDKVTESRRFEALMKKETNASNIAREKSKMVKNRLEQKSKKLEGDENQDGHSGENEQLLKKLRALELKFAEKSRTTAATTATTVELKSLLRLASN